jgi:uncharacterized protein
MGLDGVAVRENAEAGQFEIWVGDELAGRSVYEDRGDGVHAFVHTEVEPRFEGQGLAGRLVREALTVARERGWAVLPECPFVRSYVEKNPDLIDLVPAGARSRFDLP